MKFLKAILILTFILIASIIFFYLKSVNNEPESKDNGSTGASAVSENDPPKIVSTNPDPLDGVIIRSDQQIELVFNRSLENEGELKIRIEPEIKFKKTLSSDNKVAKIIPEEPFELGKSYTIYITGDTKFTGYGPWREEKTFRFQTIRYRGV